MLVSWRKTLGAVGGLSTVPSPPLDGAATWRKNARALPPVDGQLVEQEIFQQFFVTGQVPDPLPGQLQTKAFHPKMADLDRETSFARSDFDPGVRPQMEENEIVQLLQESALCLIPGISSASFGQTSAPAPGGISPAGVSGKATRSFRSCEKFLPQSGPRPREMDSNVGRLSAGTRTGGNSRGARIWKGSPMGMDPAACAEGVGAQPPECSRQAAKATAVRQRKFMTDLSPPETTVSANHSVRR